MPVQNNEALDWSMLADAYAFVGNSLLAPMTHTATAGLDPAFWQAFPTFGQAEVALAAQACAKRARELVAQAGGSDAAVTRCAVEFTRLFVGPPSPAAAPWETMYRGQDVTVGFGDATFEMRALLREAGLAVTNQNNQYEDHLGLELLYLSELCRRIDSGQAEAAQAAAFVEAHPGAWVAAFRARVAAAAPDGYFQTLLELTEALLNLPER